MPVHEALIREISESTLEENTLAFWKLGQMGYALRMGPYTVYLDAYLTAHPSRLFPSPLTPEEVVNADLVFGSHDHSDHIDRPAWKTIAKASPQALFAVPKALVDRLSDLGIDHNRFWPLSDSVSRRCGTLTVTGIPCAHEMLDTDENGNHLYSGIILSNGRMRVCHLGDTCIYPGLLERLKLFAPYDVLFLPINGRDGERLRRGCIGNMTFQEAVDLAGMVRPGLVVPGHYEMFRGNTEDVTKFTDYLDAKYPDVRCWVGESGDKMIVSRNE